MFRGTNSTGTGQTNFDLGTSGFVFGGFGRKARNSFGITVTQQANFNYTTYYNGLNDYSSYGEPLADEFAASGLTIDQALLYTSNISIPTKMGLYTYLIDTAMVNGSMQVIARSENPAVREQTNRVESSGGITEINLGWGTEASKKFMWGLSLGINIINQEKRTIFNESDATGNIYLTNYEHNAILRYRPDDRREWETIVHDPRLLWPDTLSVAKDGYLYVTANQLHRQARYQKGQDLRRKPYTLFRIRIDASPVLLR